MLALISTVFGMMMAVASDLPDLENEVQYRAARNSVLVADDKPGSHVAKLTGNRNRILSGESDASPNVRNAVVAVEDERFYTHEGVDYEGIARALWEDLRQQRAAQGGSTITQQFVKNALSTQANRSVFEKLREAALAYHLERQWSKRKVLTQYLNSVYFGNGAYGIEAAARTYFGGGRQTYGPQERVAATLAPHQAALLAGLVASPAANDPAQNPRAALRRRNLVLKRMLEQRMITRSEYTDAVGRPVPSDKEINPPPPDSTEPYFSSWVTQQLVDRYGAGRVFGGGLKIKTTIDPELQEKARQTVSARFGPDGPTASLVAIENRTGEVKALVGGDNFQAKPFNLATNGHRQPGSAFKPFALIEALEQGVSPYRSFTSRPKIFPVPDSGGEKFVVNNYEDQYAGVSTLANATVQSDNSVYAELGLGVGTKRIATLAQRMGIKTRVSTNPAMILGGLKQGVTPLEMAFAYSTIANRGRRTSGTLAASRLGPVAIERVEEGDEAIDVNRPRSRQVYGPETGEQVRQLLAGVIQSGTGKAARIGEFAAGKTGTTENYGDAWFVGFNEDWTVAVWVGYPDELRYMEHDYAGGPVAGGTFPAEIWQDFMSQAIDLREARKPPEERGGPGPGSPALPSTPQSGRSQSAGGQSTPYSSGTGSSGTRYGRSPGSAGRSSPRYGSNRRRGTTRSGSSSGSQGPPAGTGTSGQLRRRSSPGRSSSGRSGRRSSSGGRSGGASSGASSGTGTGGSR